MPLETATLISELVATNPEATDPVPQGDDHIRMLKTCLLTTFPEVDVALTGSSHDLNAAAAAFVTDGRVVVSPTSGAATVSVVNTASTGTNGAVALALSDSANANPHNVLTSDYAGNVEVLLSLNTPTLKQAGVSLIPRGIIAMWYGSVASIPAGWVLCNGQNGTPNMLDRFPIGGGASYAPGSLGGGGNLSALAAGYHQHAAVGDHAHSAWTDAQGYHAHTGATAGHVLTLAEIPWHDHGLSGSGYHNIVRYIGSGGWAAFAPGGQVVWVPGAAQGSDQAHTHGIAADGSHAHNVGVGGAGTHAHAATGDHTHVVPYVNPYFTAVVFIMKT